MEIYPSLVWKNIWEKTNNPSLATDQIWNEIQKAYSSKGRHYHNMEHIAQILKAIDDNRSRIENIEILQLAAFFHDIVYSSKRKDNEEQSADLASKKLNFLNYPEDKIKQCELFILATKDHNNNTEFHDLDYFLDADLEKLGAPWTEYLEYTQQIRKEYYIFPDIMYVPGRKKVLQHFLNLEKIYKTEEFFRQYEIAAHYNISKELEMLKQSGHLSIFA